MRVLLIDANNFFSNDFDYIGLGLPSIAGYLRSKYPQIDVQIISKGILSELNDFKPDIVGISSVSASYCKAIEIADKCKEHGIPVIIGGHHISALPSNLAPSMDVGIIGEGEHTFAEICGIVQENGWDMDRISNVKGIVYRDDNGVIRKNSPRELIQNLDTLPFPARDLLSNYEQKEPIIYSSRGCPYRCVFCSPSRFWRDVRYFSVGYVVSEIEHLVNKYGAEFIYFADDLLIADKNRFNGIVDAIDQKGLNKIVRFKIPCRANLVNEELVKQLIKMNVTEVHFGLESMDKDTLNYLKGESVSVDDNIRAVNLLNEAGIKVTVNFVIGSPDETEEQLQRTLDFIDNSEVYDYRCYLLTPLPGTPLWNYALKQNIVSEENMDWSLCWAKEVTDRTIILSKHISREKLQSIFKKYSNGKLL